MTGGQRQAPTMSLAAETLLLALDPERGGLLVRRADLDPALAAAGEADGSSSDTMRAAQKELVDGGRARRRGVLRRLATTDAGDAGERFDAIRRAIANGRFASEHDLQLFVLLAASGVLGVRLQRDEVRAAFRHLEPLVLDPETSVQPLVVSLSREHPFRAPGFAAFEDRPRPRRTRYDHVLLYGTADDRGADLGDFQEPGDGPYGNS